MLDNIDANEYARVYRRALLLLEEVAAAQHLDLHELAHSITERYFTKPDDLATLVELYVRRARREHRRASRLQEDTVGTADLSFSAKEAALDLLALYLKSRIKLSYNERYLYRHLLAGETFEEIASDLTMTVDEVTLVAKSLYAKLREPHATATPAQDRRSWIKSRLALRLHRGGGG